MKKGIIICFIISIMLLSGCQKGELNLVAKQKAAGAAVGVSGTEVGTGWSINENPEQAVKEAVDMALEGKADKSPDFVIIFAGSGADMGKILVNAKELLGDETKIYGGTSDSRGVMTNKGFVKVSEQGYEYGQMGGKRGLAVMTVSSKDIAFGVGSADFSAYSSVQEASKTAVLNAIKNAGKYENEQPDLILITPTKPDEDDALKGIEQVVGEDALVLGGTAGGPVFGVIGENTIYESGISLAVVYTDMPIGWTFEGGFDVKDPNSGIVTKIDGRNILEIDNRPALDVYNEWLDGKVDALYEEHQDPRVVKNLLTLHPLYRKYKTDDGQEYFLFSHPWPTDPTQEEKGVSTSTNIKKGDRVYLSHGTWETLVNRIGNLPKNAKAKASFAADESSIFGIGYVCAGVMGTIPETEREKLPILINYINNDSPFIATFTWGEQGHFPGICNVHGNLLTSFVVIGKE
jgi:hypothetical protein